MSTVLIFLIVIVVLVVAHELGHFFVAKSFGVRVDEFGIGYPPRAKKMFTWRGTLFTLNWLPFGGFVKIFGEETGTEGERSVSFAYQKMWKRVLIIAAGILANMVLAMILYAISFGIGFLGDPQDFPHAKLLAPESVIVTEVLAGSPAEKAGIKSGDTITNIGNNVSDVVAFIHSHPDEIVTVDVLRGDGMHSFTAKIGTINGLPGIGIALTNAAKIRLPIFRAIGMGATYTIGQFGSIIHSLIALIGGAFTGNKALLSQVSGPVGIAEIAATAYTLGFGAFLSFVALISVNLAVINLLPFPALDGGRLILELFATKGESRIPKRVVSVVNQVGFLILILLMLYVTYHDIVRLVV